MPRSPRQRRLSLGADNPRPRYSHYVHESQLKLAQLIENWEHLQAVSDIGELDAHYGPEPTVSCIGNDELQGWEFHARGIIIRPDRNVLLSILGNRLPFSARRARFHGPTETTDPVIYINYLADDDGNGLTITEFNEVLAVMEQAIEPGNVLAETLEDVRRKKADANRSAFITLEGHKYAGKVTAFCKYHRENTIPRAIEAGVERIMMPAEVGWTMHFTSRARDHATLAENSPWLFRLAFCALMHKFPRRFDMAAFVMFDITHPDEPAIAESIASHLAASYESYGGFNGDQAGYKLMDQHAVHKTAHWHTISNAALGKGYYQHSEANLEIIRKMITARAEERKARHKADVERKAAAWKVHEQVLDMGQKDGELKTHIKVQEATLEVMIIKRRRLLAEYRQKLIEDERLNIALRRFRDEINQIEDEEGPVPRRPHN